MNVAAVVGGKCAGSQGLGQTRGDRKHLIPYVFPRVISARVNSIPGYTELGDDNPVTTKAIAFLRPAFPSVSVTSQ